MGDSLSTAWNNATNNMRCLVLIGSFLACSNALDAGYGVPLAPVVHSLPLSAPVAPAPLQLVHNAPLIHSAPQPVLHSVPFPAPAPLHLAPTPIPSPAPFAAPVHFAARAPLPLAAPAPLPLAAPVPFAPIVEPPSSQFHAQDEFGQFSFGYQNINSAKTESKDAFEVTSMLMPMEFSRLSTTLLMTSMDSELLEPTSQLPLRRHLKWLLLELNILLLMLKPRLTVWKREKLSL